MSTDGTQPPSIAPKKTAGRPTRQPSGAKSVAGRGTDAGARTGARPVSAPLTGGAAPSVGERIKRTGVTTGDRSGAAVDDLEETRGRTSVGATSSAVREISRDGASAPGGASSLSGAPAAGSASSLGGAPPMTSLPRESVVREPAARPSMTSSAVAGSPRKVRLAVARIDPWSVMKLSFLLSVAVGIMIVIAAAVTWYTLDGMAVFTKVNGTISEITGDPKFFNVLEYASFKRVISLATVIAVVDVVILTALSTIGAFLYNIVSALVGGVTVTLTDD